MYHPTVDEVKQLASQGNLVPIYRELPADLETPVSVYLKLRREGPSFLLESVEGGEHLGRYSFLGVNPSLTLSAYGDKVIRSANGLQQEVLLKDIDVLDIVKDILSPHQLVPISRLPRFSGGAVGYLAYDIVRFFERLPATAEDTLNLPDAVFLLADNLVIFDHIKHRLLVLANAHLNGDVEKAYRAAVADIEATVERLRRPLPPDEGPSGAIDSELTSNFSQEEFEDIVRRAKQYISAGDIFQAVLSQRLTRRTTADPFAIYRALRQLNPSPYMFYLELADGLRLIGSSPEVLVRLEEGVAEVRPLAGTRRRGDSPAEDEALASDLLADPKERAEHIMLVDLGRNDLGRVCRYGSVHVPIIMDIERYSHVMHIVSSVRGELSPQHDAYDLLRACFPAGTVSGAPKVRAMEIIEELEGTRRGPYAGAVGYFSYSGNMDTCITIRTIVMKGQMAYLQAGAGIVADSDPTREYEETLNKAWALVEAIEIAEKGYEAWALSMPHAEKRREVYL